MRGRHLDLLAALLLTGAMIACVGSWSGSPVRSRAELLEVLVAAGESGASPRREARARGWSDRELGRAAYHHGDAALERELARRLAGSDLRFRPSPR